MTCRQVTRLIKQLKRAVDAGELHIIGIDHTRYDVYRVKEQKPFPEAGAGYEGYFITIEVRKRTHDPQSPPLRSHLH
jgi:hypothetical protein